MSRLVMLSGPSCVGKGPLHTALKRFYPNLNQRLEMLVLFNSRAPRPGEQDGTAYHFRTRDEIEALRGQQGYIVQDVRGDLQALKIADLQQVLERDRDPFFEGNPFIPMEIIKSPLLSSIPKLSVFLSPLSRDELLYLKDPDRRVSLATLVTDVQRRKLLHRARKQKGILALTDLENIERRAGSAYQEMRLAHHFDFVIPLHDGEANDNWDAFYYPISDARRALLAFAAILRGAEAPYAERWEPGLLG